MLDSGELALDPAIYLADFDADAEGGRGRARLTTNRGEALKFPSLAEALEFYQQQSKALPYREDGKPNRPLTSYTIELELLERDGHEHELGF